MVEMNVSWKAQPLSRVTGEMLAIQKRLQSPGISQNKRESLQFHLNQLQIVAVPRILGRKVD
ncbi:hypothetical protein ACFL06_01830 [Patescibacteria group bacterium]